MHDRRVVWVLLAASCWLLCCHRVTRGEVLQLPREASPDDPAQPRSWMEEHQQRRSDLQRARLERDQRNEAKRNKTLARLHIEPGPLAPGDTPPKRVLVYCMQNAGCTLFSLLLAQLPGALVIPDLYVSSYVRTPRPSMFEHVKGVSLIVVKVTINGADPLPRLAEHKHRFQPDVTILYVRDPWVNVAKLVNKPYGTECGTPESKVTALEEMYRERERLANVTVYYHELCLETDRLIARLKAAGVGDGSDFVRPAWRRSMGNILADALARTAKHPTFRFGGGNVQGGGRGEKSKIDLTSCRAALVKDLTTFAPHGLCELNISQLAPAMAKDHLELRAKLGVPAAPACEPAPDFRRFELFPSLPHCTTQPKRTPSYDWPVPPHALPLPPQVWNAA